MKREKGKRPTLDKMCELPADPSLKHQAPVLKALPGWGLLDNTISSGFLGQSGAAGWGLLGNTISPGFLGQSGAAEIKDGYPAKKSHA